MRKFKVKSLSVGGKNNKIYYSGDTVTADMFAADVDALVKNGYLVEIFEPVKAKEETPKTDTDKVKPTIQNVSNRATKGGGRGRPSKK